MGYFRKRRRERVVFERIGFITGMFLNRKTSQVSTEEGAEGGVYIPAPVCRTIPRNTP